jgi:aryl sulfotransferase
MQTIVACLLWPKGDAPGAVMFLSPWLDANFDPVHEIVARLDAQQHRRFIKTHTPIDGIPFFGDASYVFVARDGRDAFMSYCNHLEKFRADVRTDLNHAAELEGLSLMPEWDGDVHGLFRTWLATTPFFHHVETFWERRDRPNVLLVHFADLKTDLEGQMRRVSTFLEVDVPDALWPSVVERCTFDSMRGRATEIGSFERRFDGGAESFFFKGTNGRWRDVLTPDEREAYDARAASVLSPDALAWLQRG